MNFEDDGFISYAHLDNVGLVEGGRDGSQDFIARWRSASGSSLASRRNSTGIRSFGATTSSATHSWSGSDVSPLWCRSCRPGI